MNRYEKIRTGIVAFVIVAAVLAVITLFTFAQIYPLRPDSVAGWAAFLIAWPISWFAIAAIREFLGKTRDEESPPRQN